MQVLPESDDVFFEPSQASRAALAELGLAHNPFLALVVPRPIGWISSLSPEGIVNLAPFSFFNGVSQRPPMVVFCANGAHAETGDKDSLANVRDTGEFVANLATWDLRWKMNATSAPAPRSVDEFEVAGLTKAPSRLVKVPRVAESPVTLECVVVKIVDLLPDERSGARNTATFGRVVGMHIDRRLIVEGKVDISRARPIARLGYLDYTGLGEIFSMPRPAWPVQEEAIGGASIS
jgi:flavin reductase (DIM6/NTAB) family NADH-FMN oxidoreductase RutF